MKHGCLGGGATLLAPGYWDWRPTREESVGDKLQEFLAYMDGTAEAALPMLLKILRDHGGEPANTLADMIDPEKPTAWALDLIRKRQGKPPARGWRTDDWIATDYYHCRSGLEDAEHPTPDKEALSQVAASTGLSVETIRQIVKRDRAARRKWLKGQKSVDF